MPTGPLNNVVPQLRQAFLRGQDIGSTDGQLLERFVGRGDETALEILVRRHSPMVWNVCRRLLSHHQDAEDAFQATFLVLVRKVASIVPREMVGNWLYGVAYQTALKARASAAKRQSREKLVTRMPEPELVQPDPWPELQPLLDQELNRLPAKYRVAIVLCDLEGKTRKEAAGQLGLPEGTVASRLGRARAMLAKRLTKQGVVLSGAVLAAALSRNAPAVVPARVLSATLKVAIVGAAGQATSALIGAKVAALTEGVLQAMLLNKLKTITMVLLAVGMVTLTTAMLAIGQRPDKVEWADKPEGKKNTPRTTAALGGEDRIRPGDRLQIQATGTLPDRPIHGVFQVEPGGTVALGVGYGRVQVKGQTLEEAEHGIRDHLEKWLRSVDVAVTRAGSLPDERVQSLERRLGQLEDEVRALRATVEDFQTRVKKF